MPADLHAAHVGPDPVGVMNDRRRQPQHPLGDLVERVGAVDRGRFEGVRDGHLISSRAVFGRFAYQCITMARSAQSLSVTLCILLKIAEP